MGLISNRIAITGIGVVSSIGIGKVKFWNSLISGKIGISKIEGLKIEGFPCNFAGEIKDFDANKYLNLKRLKFLGKTSQFAIVASKFALEDSDLINNYKAERMGVCVGVTMGESSSIEDIDSIWLEKGREGVNLDLITRFPGDSLSSNIALAFKIQGISLIIPTACAAGNYAIGYASDLIKKGEVDCVLAGGADVFTRVGFVGFNRLYAMAPEKCQPFDKNRKGMILGEGAAILVLESLDSALERKADIYAEVLGYGLSCDAYHMTQPTEEGISKCMIKAMDEAGIGIEDVDYISAHGTGTRQNDKTEVAAIKRVFGKRYKKIPVSSIKSMLGHTMGAAAAIEAAACCLALKEGILPPTINYETLDPECDIDCVPNKAREQRVDIVLNNSYAFGGNNACLVLKRYS